MMKLVDIVANHDCMACIGAALITDDKVFAFSENIDQLTFGLVAPLQTNYAFSWHPELLRFFEIASAKSREIGSDL